VARGPAIGILHIVMARKKFLRLANAVNRGEFAKKLDFDDNGMFVALKAIKTYVCLDEQNARLVLWAQICRVESDERRILANTCAIYTARNFFERGCVLAAAGEGRVAILGCSMELQGLDANRLTSEIRLFAETARAATKLLDTDLTAARIIDAHRFARELFSYSIGDTGKN
jgi:hypothetical protein